MTDAVIMAINKKIRQAYT